jgi:hypothetical protein
MRTPNTDPSPLPCQADFSSTEIYLLERFISPTYLAEVRDTWGEMIKHVESCLARFMRTPPAGYRAKHLSYQPDAVWGNHVLPNFRHTYDLLASSVIALANGDMRALGAAHGPFNDCRAQREYSTDWMSEDEAKPYFDLLYKASGMAANVCATAEPYWKPGEVERCDSYIEEIEITRDLPKYRLCHEATVRTDEPVHYAGIYAPDCERSCVQFLKPHDEAPPAIVVRGTRDLLHPTSGEKYGEEPIYASIPCLWTLVERESNGAERKDTMT